MVNLPAASWPSPQQPIELPMTGALMTHSRALPAICICITAKKCSTD